MENEKEIRNMIYLLDDSDDRVIEHIESQLMDKGSAIIPFLEKVWPEEEDVERQERILGLIKRIKQMEVVEDLLAWKQSKTQNLLDGVLIVEKILDPLVERKLIEMKLDKIKLDAWLEMNYDLTSFEKVKILNHILFDVHQFSGDTDNYHHSSNSFISSVLERKKGNPVSLAIIYSIVAQRLNIPIFGVNLPQHFILGYIQDVEWQPLKRFNDPSVIRNEEGSEIMFYINPFNEGLIFNRDHIHKFLEQLSLEPKEEYFKACSNLSIVRRILKNLEMAYTKEKNDTKLELVHAMAKALSDD